MVGTAHSPRSVVVVLMVWPVAALITETSAPGTAAPAGSVTMPSRRLVFCENRNAAKIQNAAKSFFICVPP